MKQLFIGGLMLSLMACSSEQEEVTGGTEIQQETLEVLKTEEMFQQELDAIDRELDSLMDVK